MSGERDDESDTRNTGPAAESDESLSQYTLDALLKELKLSSSSTMARDRSRFFEPFLSLPTASLLSLGLDVAVAAGLSGDWASALKILQTMLKVGDDRTELKLWQLRCLVELQEFGEALALSKSVGWKAAQMVHVNYLTGFAFEGLDMRAEARLRFDAVYKRDPLYRNVSEKL